MAVVSKGGGRLKPICVPPPTWATPGMWDAGCLMLGGCLATHPTAPPGKAGGATSQRQLNR